MSSGFKFIDHTADIAIEVSGSTYEELFNAAVEGWKETSIEPSVETGGLIEKIIKLEEDSPEVLLVSFLQEMNYNFLSKKIFPAEIKGLRIYKKDNRLELKCKILFRNISQKDFIKTEIKAVTFHQLDIKKTGNVYRTIIVFDI